MTITIYKIHLMRPKATDNIMNCIELFLPNKVIPRHDRKINRIGKYCEQKNSILI